MVVPQNHPLKFWDLHGFKTIQRFRGIPVTMETSILIPYFDHGIWDPTSVGSARWCLCQWPFQEPKLEVSTIYKAYVRKYPHKIWPYMVQYLHFRILEFPLTMPAIGFPEYLPRIQKHPNIPRNSRIPRPWYLASADASGAMAWDEHCAPTQSMGCWRIHLPTG